MRQSEPTSESETMTKGEAERADEQDSADANGEDDDMINQAIGERVRALLVETGQPMRWLCEQVARRTGERELSVPGLIKWLDQPDRVLPYRIFAIEEVLELPEGSLSRVLGYVPASAVPNSDVVSAVMLDERLSEPSKRALLAAYREMVRGGARPKTAKHRSRSS